MIVFAIRYCVKTIIPTSVYEYIIWHLVLYFLVQEFAEIVQKKYVNFGFSSKPLINLSPRSRNLPNNLMYRTHARYTVEYAREYSWNSTSSFAFLFNCFYSSFPLILIFNLTWWILATTHNHAHRNRLTKKRSIKNGHVNYYNLNTRSFVFRSWKRVGGGGLTWTRSTSAGSMSTAVPVLWSVTRYP